VLRVLIYEYVTGGGFLEKPTFSPILSEAYAILNALLEDFSRNEGYETTTILDNRIAENVETKAGRRIVRISSNAGLDLALKSALSEVDAAIVVAPETEGMLEKLTKTVEENGGPILLGSNSDALKRVSNKETALELAKSIGIPVPETSSASVSEGENAIYALARDIGLPVIIKPQIGAGCESVYVINSRSDLSRMIEFTGGIRSNRELLVQEYVKGIDASVSALVSRDGHTAPLSLNRQQVELKSPSEKGSSYQGGYTPFDHPLLSDTFDSARKIAETVQGLRGYVGIDFVLTDDSPVFMELNARITTSYTGLCRVFRSNGRKGVAQAIIDAATKSALPKHITFDGFAAYSKLKLDPNAKLGSDAIHRLSTMDSVLSPPFLEQEGEKEVFLVNVGASLSDAWRTRSHNEERIKQAITASVGV